MTSLASSVTTSTHSPARSTGRTWVMWLLTAAAFPPSVALALLLGPVDDMPTALAGGALSGLGIGLAQWLVLRRRLPSAAPWAPVTAVAAGVGLAAGSAAVSYATTLPALAAQGAVTGLVVGAAQGAVLARGLGRPSAGLVWAAAGPALWALGWTVTTLAGVGVDQQFAVFGATGAAAHAAVGGLLMARLLHRGAR